MSFTAAAGVAEQIQISEAAPMIVLTSRQARDLRYLVALYRLTIGLTRQRYADGDSIRTGRALERKGLVKHAFEQYSNRAATWVPTTAGVQYVETNFVPFDRFHAEAIERALGHLRSEARV